MTYLNYYFCINCGKELIGKHRKTSKYCSNKCQSDRRYYNYIFRWKLNLNNGMKKNTDLSKHVRRYLFHKYNNSCCMCGGKTWLGEPIPLEIDHLDGNHTNSSENNLRTLCPNCHALTPTYKNKNKGRGRKYRNKK